MKPSALIPPRRMSVVLGLLVLCLSAPGQMAASPVEFKGIYITDAEQWFSLSTDSEIRWVTIGSIFAGYTIAEYQETSRRLKLILGGEIIYVAMNEPSSGQQVGGREHAGGSTLRLKRDVSASAASLTQVGHDSMLSDKAFSGAESRGSSYSPETNAPHIAADQQLNTGVHQTIFSVRVEPRDSGVSDEDDTETGEAYLRKTPPIIKEPRPDQYIVY